MRRGTGNYDEFFTYKGIHAQHNRIVRAQQQGPEQYRFAGILFADPEIIEHRRYGTRADDQKRSVQPSSECPARCA